MYITNRELAEEIAKSKIEGKLTNCCVDYIMRLASRLSRKGNFAGYSYRDELECAAIVALYRKLLQFNPAKSDNPFAYASTIAWNAILAELKSQKKQATVRDNLMREMGVVEDHRATSLVDACYDPWDEFEASFRIGKQDEHERLEFSPVQGYPDLEASPGGEVRKIAHMAVFASGKRKWVDAKVLKRCGRYNEYVAVDGEKVAWAELVARSQGAEIVRQHDDTEWRRIDDLHDIDRIGRVRNRKRNALLKPVGATMSYQLHAVTARQCDLLRAFWPETIAESVDFSPHS